jgi:two-component system, chemotaxis family, sensor kinase CheA
MSNFMDDHGGELRELFFETSGELLQALNDSALYLEGHPGDVDTLQAIRRIVHTLKGDSAACGFRELSETAHTLEDVLGTEQMDPASVSEIAFAAADVFHSMLDAYRRNLEAPTGEALQELVRKLGPATKAGKVSKKMLSGKPVTIWSEYELLAQENARQQGKNIYQITATIDPACTMPIAARQLLLTALGSSGEIIGSRPEKNSVTASPRMELLIATDKSAPQISSRAKIPTVISQVEVVAVAAAAKNSRGTKLTKLSKATAVKEGPAVSVEQPAASLATSGDVLSSGVLNNDVLNILPVPEPEPAPVPVVADAHTPESSSTPVVENTLRVDAERIDNVLNLVGELIIGKSMLQQALNEFTKLNPKDPMRGKFADALAFQSRVLNDLQRSVMKVRMVPVEQLFRRFPRLVRDVSKQCGKQVDLLLSGQDTDLDKGLLDSIAEPLTHIVRNSVSHGIELPDERVRLGKAPRGAIHLRSHHQGNQVIIEIEDDGRGIDPQKLKAKAVQQGLISAEEAARLTEAETLELIFLPGFSTADQITEISGRGVGLDVVRSVLHRLKGSAEVEARLGHGTTFRLKVPLTLAIIKALLFRVEGRLYAIPLNAVAEISRAHERDLHQVEQYEVVQLRNQVLPLVRLGRRPAEQNGTAAQRIFILVIRSGERKLGLVVDGLDGEEELVIKALDDKTVATDLISGASILGDGRVVLIMNLAGVMDRFNKSRSSQSGNGFAGLLLSQLEQSRLAASAGGSL